MSQLIFQPALDPLHAVFRFLRLFPVYIEAKTLPIDHIRILDFYLLFPFRIRSLRLAPAHQHFKTLAEKYAHLTPYGEQPDPPLLFARMKPMQIAALETLASKNYIDQKAFQAGTFKATDQKLPEELLQRISLLNIEQSDLIDFLKLLALSYDLSGENGLKARSQIMDFRYDAI